MKEQLRNNSRQLANNNNNNENNLFKSATRTASLCLTPYPTGDLGSHLPKLLYPTKLNVWDCSKLFRVRTQCQIKLSLLCVCFSKLRLNGSLVSWKKTKEDGRMSYWNKVVAPFHSPTSSIYRRITLTSFRNSRWRPIWANARASSNQQLQLIRIHLSTVLSRQLAITVEHLRCAPTQIHWPSGADLFLPLSRFYFALIAAGSSNPSAPKYRHSNSSELLLFCCCFATTNRDQSFILGRKAGIQ